MGPSKMITSVRRRRSRSPGDKEGIVDEREQQGMSISTVARKYGLYPSRLFT